MIESTMLFAHRPYALVIPLPVGVFSVMGEAASPYTVAELEKMKRLTPARLSSFKRVTCCAARVPQKLR